MCIYKILCEWSHWIIPTYDWIRNDIECVWYKKKIKFLRRIHSDFMASQLIAFIQDSRRNSLYQRKSSTAEPIRYYKWKASTHIKYIYPLAVIYIHPPAWIKPVTTAILWFRFNNFTRTYGEMETFSRATPSTDDRKTTFIRPTKCRIKYKIWSNPLTWLSYHLAITVS